MTEPTFSSKSAAAPTNQSGAQQGNQSFGNQEGPDRSSSSQPAQRAPRSSADDEAPTSVIPVASKSNGNRTAGEQKTALQTREKQSQDKQKSPRAAQSSSQRSQSKQNLPRRRDSAPRTGTREAADQANPWRTQLIAMAVIYAVAIALGVLIGFWITQSMDTISGAG